ncbi:MAG: guanylate kinase [Clostridia bacterium]|nr:guanylate kinase [Clostridia bacterium]MBQ2237113.1 guanylate kinase [Clostridia bacterium]
MRRKQMSKGNIYIVSGPSGSGKDTLLAELFKRIDNIFFSISSITRPMREGEKEGEKYNFISKEKFISMIGNNELLEHNNYVGNYYGTPKAPVLKASEEGKDVIIEVDVNGAAAIRSKLSDTVSIFIMPPSFEELRKRLSGRGTESDEVIAERMYKALEEIGRAKEYDYIVVNDDLDTAVNNAVSIILSNRLKLDKNLNVIDEVLNNVKS